MMRLTSIVLFLALSLSSRAADIFLWHRDGAGDFERIVLEVTPEYVLGFDADGMPEMQAPSAGSGDVVGPASAVTGRIAIFDGITGKILADGGSTIANVLARANHTGSQLLSTISDAGALASLNTVASATITNDSIVNEDISASAAIALSKLATDPLARANHTGTQAAGTITGLASVATSGSASDLGTGSLPDARLSSNVALENVANNFSAAQTVSVNGAASTPALSLTGAGFTGGTGTTTFPHLYLNESASTASSTLSTAGTSFGINRDAATGNIFDLMQDGNSLAVLSADGTMTLSNRTASTGITKLILKNGPGQSINNYLLTLQNTSGTALGFWGDVNGIVTLRSPIIQNASDFQLNDSGLKLKSAGTVQFSSTTNYYDTIDLILGREAAATLQQGADSATPIAQTFKGPDARAGTDTNAAGGNMSIAAGRGTGTANGGSATIQTSVATTTGTAAGTLTAREFYFGGEKSMTESTATTLVNITLGTGKYIGGTLVATTHADDATDYQATTEHLTFSAVNKAGTVTTTIQGTPSTSTTAASAGTLTTTWTSVANAASIDIKNSAVSSLTQTTLKVSYKLTLNGDAATTITP